MNSKVWEASGHLAGFSDPLVDGKQFNMMFQTKVGAGEEAQISYLRPETAQILPILKMWWIYFIPNYRLALGKLAKRFGMKLPHAILFSVCGVGANGSGIFCEAGGMGKVF